MKTHPFAFILPFTMVYVFKHFDAHSVQIQSIPCREKGFIIFVKNAPLCQSAMNTRTKHNMSFLYTKLLESKKGNIQQKGHA